MSRIGKLPISIPEKVEITLKDNHMTCKGPLGELSRELHPEMNIKIEDGQILVTRPSESKSHRALHGLTRSLIANMVEGVSTGFTKKLEIIGVGYRAQTSGQKITLNLGYSHSIEYKIPEGVKVEMDQENKNIIIVNGIDKQSVGEVAAQIRKFRPPEPYKGKGVRYIDEYVHRKAGKAAAKAA